MYLGRAGNSLPAVRGTYLPRFISTAVLDSYWDINDEDDAYTPNSGLCVPSKCVYLFMYWDEPEIIAVQILSFVDVLMGFHGTSNQVPFNLLGMAGCTI